MRGKRLAPEMLRAVAERFKVLAEPARLSVLNQLRGGPCSVSELIEATGLNQANLSKHLQLLHAHGFVVRRRDGAFVIYDLADRSVFELCDIMCGQLKRRADEQVTRLRALG
ncbi:MAG: ArsR/SmtB family transcription factor [Vicinamibacterales bacterium]|jgi:DNA-binding transcriptional ArsR family regulator